MTRLTRLELIDKALMISDNLAIIHDTNYKNNNSIQFIVISMYNFKCKTVIKLNSNNAISIVSSTSGTKKSMLKRSVEAIKRNREQLLEYLNT